MVSDQLKIAYQEAPISHLKDGYFHCCSIGNLLLRMNKGNLICENERCRSNGNYQSGRTIYKSEGAQWLRCEIRRFWHAPGLAELRLARRLQKLGVEVELWPNFDSYDLRVMFPDGETWAVDVKDWGSPFRLAHTVTPIPPEPPWMQAYFVFPDERRKQRSDYKRAFKNHLLKPLDKRTKPMFEREFITQVKQKLKQVNNA